MNDYYFDVPLFGDKIIPTELGRRECGIPNGVVLTFNSYRMVNGRMHLVCEEPSRKKAYIIPSRLFPYNYNI